MDFGLRGIHVLISGAAGGIGIEIVKTFQNLGARVTAHYNTNIGALQDNGAITIVQADVRDEASVERMFDEAVQAQGPIGILVVNHGLSLQTNASIADMSLSQWQTSLDVNLTGTFLLARGFLRQLRSAPEETKSTANLVFIGSTAGKFGEALHADYAAAKSAIMYGLMLSVKNEIVAIAPRARVNAVNPGWTATKKKEQVLSDRAFVDRVTATIPLRKVAEPSDIARQVAVIASPVLSSHVNGMNIFVDGGMEGRLLFPPSSA